MKSYTTILFIALIFLWGCEKNNEQQIFGNVTITGKVSDIISGTILPGCPVELVGHRYLSRGRFEESHVVARDTTDVNGNYSISITGTGETWFEVIAHPTNDLYLRSNIGLPFSEYIETPGTFTRDLQLKRSSFLKVSVINTPPLVAADSLYLYSLFSQVELRNFSKDSIVYLKLLGDPSTDNPISFSHGYQQLPGDSNFYIKVNGWDTVAVQYRY